MKARRGGRVQKKGGAHHRHQCVYLCGSIGLSFLCCLGIVLYFGSFYRQVVQLDLATDRPGALVSNVLYRELEADIKALRSVRLADVSSQMLQWEESIINSTFHRMHLAAATTDETKETKKEKKVEEKTSSSSLCPHIDLVRFWRPPTEADLRYRTPFASPPGSGGPTKYVTFEPDVGGWNNIRMQMEAVLVFAAATGRTLVLPPDQPMYLLNKGKGHHNEHSFADFFPFDLIRRVVPVVSMEEFMKREAVTGQLRSSATGSVLYPPGNKTTFVGTDARDRNAMWEYLRVAASCPPWKCMREYLVIPRYPGFNSTLQPPAEAAEYERRRLVFAGEKKYGMERGVRYYDDFWHGTKVIHFISKPGGGYRLLQHFYTFIHFEDPFMDRYYKRFVRDYVHYIPAIFCKAALIINSLQREASSAGGRYSSFHVRRGEFQYKETRLPAEDLVKNVGHYIPQGQLLFIATDERNKSFFGPFRQRFPNIRFLDDFSELAGLRGINPNYLGMIDQVVCTRGELFMGTWFSTFTGFITRMRGYLGLPDNSTRYTDMKHRDRFQVDELPRFPFYMREFPLAWSNIDEG